MYIRKQKFGPIPKKTETKVEEWAGLKHELPIHGPTVRFLKWNPYLQFCSHFSQPEEAEGAQAECSSQDWPLMNGVLA